MKSVVRGSQLLAKAHPGANSEKVLGDAECAVRALKMAEASIAQNRDRALRHTESRRRVLDVDLREAGTVVLKVGSLVYQCKKAAMRLIRMKRLIEGGDESEPYHNEKGEEMPWPESPK